MPKKSVEKDPASIGDVPVSFEAAMEELNSLVADMESGSLALEASLQAYQRGAQLIQFCAAQLERVEQQVKILDQGILKPFNVKSDEGSGDLV